MTNSRRFTVVSLLALAACFELVDVGSNDGGGDAGADGGTLVCTIGQDQTCNEVASMSAFAGSCGASGCVCVGGFEKGPTGKCRPQNSCPATAQQPGQACTVPGITCRYGYAPIECGGRTVRCEGTTWGEVEHTDPQALCGGLGLMFQPTSVDFGSVAVGAEGTLDVMFFNPNLRVVQLSGLAVRDGAGPSTIFSVVSANPGDVTRLTVPPAQRDAASGTISPGTATVTLRFQPNAAGSRTSTLVATTDLSPQPSLSIPVQGRGTEPMRCTGSGNDQSCNELQGMSSFAGQCVSGLCVCATGFEPSPSGRCQPIGSRCTDRVAMSCNDGPVDGGVGGVAGSCVVGQCVCNTGFELNPRTGRCWASRASFTCTVGQDATCNGDAAMSALAGTCSAGRCSCNPGFALASDGRCVASATGSCLVSDGTGVCALTTLDGGTTSNTSGQCGTQALSAGCSCTTSGSPGVGQVLCTGVCPPTAGRTCVSTNCGMVNCLPPTRCIAENRCAVP